MPTIARTFVSAASVVALVVACGGPSLPRSALDARSAGMTSCDRVAAPARVDCLAKVPSITPDEPKHGACAVFVRGRGWSAEDAPACTRILDASRTDDGCDGPTSSRAALERAKRGCENRLAHDATAAQCLWDWTPRPPEEAWSTSCMVGVAEERAQTEARLAKLIEELAALEKKETEEAPRRVRNARREEEVARRAKHGYLTIGQQASRQAERWCAARWVEKVPDDNGRCVELRARDIGDYEVCWGHHNKPNGLSEPRDPNSFTSEPRDCFTVPLTEEEQTSCQAACSAGGRGAVEKAFTGALDACLAAFVDGGMPKQGCTVERPSATTLVSAEELETRRAACSADCKKRGPEAKRQTALDKAREAQRAQQAERRDGCVSKCERESERKCAGLPDRGLVGQKSLCLSDALKRCCPACGASVNTNNYSMCTH